MGGRPSQQGWKGRSHHILGSEARGLGPYQEWDVVDSRCRQTLWAPEWRNRLREGAEDPRGWIGGWQRVWGENVSLEMERGLGAGRTGLGSARLCGHLGVYASAWRNGRRIADGVPGRKSRLGLGVGNEDGEKKSLRQQVGYVCVSRGPDGGRRSQPHPPFTLSSSPDFSRAPDPPPRCGFSSFPSC